MRPKPLTSGHSREGSGCRGWVRLQMLRDLGHLWLLDTSSFWKIIINSYFLFFMVLYAPQILEGLQNQRIMVGGGGGGCCRGTEGLLLGGLHVLELDLREAISLDLHQWVSSALSHLLWLQTDLVLLFGMVSEDHSEETLSRLLFPAVGPGVSSAPQ